MSKRQRRREERDQSYYWTDEWQANEAAAVEEIQAGKVHRFTTGSDAATWLMDAED